MAKEMGQSNVITVLIVDDDIPIIESICKSVHWQDLNIGEVYTANSVLQAKQILRHNTVDIISDIEMPKESGLDLLRWVRQEQKDCEFLFLTCHETFEYAADAINYNAAAYLTKPFEQHLLELTLGKLLDIIYRKQSLTQSSLWMKKNRKEVKLNFWKMLLGGQLLTEAKINEEKEARKITLDANEDVRLFYFKISSIEADAARLGRPVFEFMLECFISEILFDEYMNESVVKTACNGGLGYVLVISNAENERSLYKKYDQIVRAFGEYMNCKITACISNPCALIEVPAVKERLEKLFKYNLGHFGKILKESELLVSQQKQSQIMDLSVLTKMIEEQDKAKILRYIKSIFNELSVHKNLDVHSLYLIQQELIQMVYADLLGNGIQATLLFHDEIYINIFEKALDSTVDLVRWANYLLEKSFDYKREIRRSNDVIEKIQSYIHQYEFRNISRNEIAKHLFLAPEYLSKLYKKKTGQTLKDYMNECRINKAKQLLREGAGNVSSVAEKVGFDNFSYFSTLFKKIEGVTPKEYRKRFYLD